MKVIVIGCTHAGIAAIKQILINYPTAEITVYERQENISYLSCATYLHIEGTVKSLEETFYAEPEDFVKQGVNMRIRHDVIKVDAATHTLMVQNLITKEIFNDTYDKLIMAAGSSTAIPAITGIENPRVLLCKTYDQAHDLCQKTVSQPRIGILGGGHIGIELAEGYAKAGHEVTLFQRPKYLLDKYVEPNLSLATAELLKSHGIKVLTDTTVTSFDEDPDGSLVIATQDGRYHVDMATVSAGMLPNTKLLKGQVDMTANGAIITDDYMYTSDENILAAGDAAVVHLNVTNQSAYLPLASQAVRQGALAGMNVGERRVRTFGTQITSGMLVFDHTIAESGLTLKAAKAAHLNATTAHYDGPYRPNFMPDAFEVNIELVYDRNSRQVLGVQLMSQHDVSQSANVVSMLIQNHGTIDQLAMVDMLFSPNFNNPFDYLNLVGQIAVTQENGYARS